MFIPDWIWFIALVLMHPATWITVGIVVVLLLGLGLRAVWMRLRKSAKKGGAQ